MSARREFIGSAIGLLIVGPWETAPADERFTIYPNAVEDWNVKYTAPAQAVKFTITHSDGSAREIEMMPGDTISSAGSVSVEGKP